MKGKKIILQACFPGSRPPGNMILNTDEKDPYKLNALRKRKDVIARHPNNIILQQKIIGGFNPFNDSICCSCDFGIYELDISQLDFTQKHDTCRQEDRLFKTIQLNKNCSQAISKSNILAHIDNGNHYDPNSKRSIFLQYVNNTVQLVSKSYTIEDLKSESKLSEFESYYGGNSQGTTVLIKGTDSTYYIIQQETNTSISLACNTITNLTYIPQKRLSGFHAEMRFIKYFSDNSKTVSGTDIWVSKPICKYCKDKLISNGVNIKTSTSDDIYRNWIDPDTMTQSTVPSNPIGRVIGRSSELDRLKSFYWEKKD